MGFERPEKLQISGAVQCLHTESTQISLVLADVWADMRTFLFFLFFCVATLFLHPDKR